MDQSKITVRYAKAFFNLAKEKQLLDPLKKDIDVVAKLLVESTDFVLLLQSPVVKTSQKVNILKSIFTGKVNELTVKFLVLITENKREVHISGICRNFLDLYRKEQGVKTARISSAITLPKATIKHIQERLEKEYNAHVELNELVNKDLLGGFVLRVDDRQIDASLATQLKKVKETLLQTEINK
ncbi:MAG TPA: ATP synthase F1 subunit delta [Sunxiuqinia sp.]|nr:ATP synthase F1 subunit delta [Sunxiuqinia sp.]